MPATPLASLADWNSLERATDRWASVGAFGLAMLACALFIFVH